MIKRYFCPKDVDPFDTVEWERRTAFIDGANFKQENVEFPVKWSQTSTNIVSQKFFAGKLGTPEREDSLKQIINRITKRIREEGLKDGYFESEEEADIFVNELKYMFVHQMFSWNSPVLFNVGNPNAFEQIAACFILGIDDTMESIEESVGIEMEIYRSGSGAGANYSNLRSSKEHLSGGGLSCFTKDTRVLTDNGLIRICDVIPGKDYAITPSGKYLITHLHANGVLPVFKYTFSDGRTIKCTDGHEFYAFDKIGNLNKYPIRELVNNDNLTTLCYSALNGNEMIQNDLTIDFNSDNTFCNKNVNLKLDSKLSLSSNKIVSVEYLGEEEVFDITVDKVHQFVANGMLVSNSGPCSFLKISDAAAGVTKSGGKNRRAARLTCLEADHGDIFEFITQKGKEEKKAKALIAAGFSDRYDDPEGAYSSVFFQNENRSVQISDAFMNTVDADGDWALIERKRFVMRPSENFTVTAQGRFYSDGVNDYLFNGNTFQKVIEWVKARDLFNAIVKEAWTSGDPGLQFSDIINRMNTCKNSGRIRSSNPCGEYLFLDNTSCNLASINLLKFWKEGIFDVESFEQAVELIFISQDIFINFAHYPHEKITEATKRYRTIGLGYANLGALLMHAGYAYDSEEARDLASAITALMHFKALSVSSKLGEKLGSFPEYWKNVTCMNEVIAAHKAALNLNKPQYSYIYDRVIGSIKEIGPKMRNAQVTLLAPTGTISFLMDCDSTGIEPLIFLQTTKLLTGGGTMTIAPKCVEVAIETILAKDEKTRGKSKEVIDYITKHNTIVGAPYISKEYYPLFATAAGSDNYISPDGHIEMMAAVQPFLSGAISKTINLPKDVDVKFIEDIYMKSWKMNLKSVTIYRDGCKSSQPLNDGKKDLSKVTIEDILEESNKSVRRRMPVDAMSKRHKFSIAGVEGYIHAGMFENGSIGEIFVEISKEGSTLAGLVDGWATILSIALQYGIPVDSIVEKFKGTRFEPSGFTLNENIRTTTSILDYIVRWIECEFITKDKAVDKEILASIPKVTVVQNTKSISYDGPACSCCGGLTYRKGSCYVCSQCGTTTGCG